MENINFNLFKNAKLIPFAEKSNPIRFLSTKKLINIADKKNFNLLASKRMLQSYDLKEEKFRLDRYLAFQKN
tara:strand:- start:173 stop:388 length:216 start_codon:yes stop_codon:yes gene_type:complete